MKRICGIILSVFLLLSLTACSRNTGDIAVYEQLAVEDKIMPALDELGDYISVQSLCHHESELFFSWSGWNLIVDYTADNYALQKAQIEEAYRFKSHPYSTSERERYIPDEGCPYETTVDRFRFRGLDDRGYFGDSTYENFPKLVYMIGFNDVEHQIAYVRFHDQDLDAADALEELLRNAGWYQMTTK